MKGRNTYVLSTRVPDALYKRVNKLAEKRGVTVSDWLKVIVVNAAKYKLPVTPTTETAPVITTAIIVTEEEMFDDREEV